MIKKILVTGGGGYIGSALVDELVSKNYEVTVLDLFIYGKNVFNNIENLKLVQGDVRNTNLLNKIN